ncbi:MAG: hypothetical protein ABIJ41_03855 [Candidatus Omnitrophota bacterium]
MFKFLNHILRRPALIKSFSLKKRGQIAIVIVVVIAILLVFLAITYNLGQVAQNKTLTMIAANQGAAIMGSFMASYAENVYQTVMNGESECDDDLTICGWSGVAKILFAIIVVAVLTYFLGPAGTLASFAFLAGIIMRIGGGLIRMFFTEPAITEAWEKQWENLSLENKVAEQGLMMSLQFAVNDTAKLIDYQDLDLDGRFGDQDKVGRFQYYNFQRLEALVERGEIDEEIIKRFQNALCEFVYQGEDDWGLIDPADSNHRAPVCPIWKIDLSDPSGPMIRNEEAEENFCDFAPAHPCCGSDPPPQCNHCCQPPSDEGDPDYDARFPLRPECCDAASDSCGTATTCPATDWPYIYDPLYQNPENGFRSFLEQIGRDDENMFEPPPAPDPQFIREDSEDDSLYRSLWNFDYYVDMDYSGYVDPNHPGACFWCDDGAGFCPDNPDVNWAAAGADGSPYNWCIPHQFRETAAGPLYRIDYIRNFVDVKMDEETQCYDHSTTSKPWWKPGADRFCSRVFPYNDECPGRDCPATCPDPCSAGTGDCLKEYICEALPEPPAPPADQDEDNDDYEPPERSIPAYWHDDSVDEVRYNMSEFIAWAIGVMREDPHAIARKFMIWYSTFEENMRKLDEEPAGRLSKFRKEIDQWSETINTWRFNTNFTGAGAHCPQGSAALNLNGVIQCLWDKYIWWENRVTQLEQDLANLEQAVVDAQALVDQYKDDIQPCETASSCPIHTCPYGAGFWGNAYFCWHKYENCLTTCENTLDYDLSADPDCLNCCGTFPSRFDCENCSDAYANCGSGPGWPVCAGDYSRYANWNRCQDPSTEICPNCIQNFYSDTYGAPVSAPCAVPENCYNTYTTLWMHRWCWRNGRTEILAGSTPYCPGPGNCWWPCFRPSADPNPPPACGYGYHNNHDSLVEYFCGSDRETNLFTNWLTSERSSAYTNYDNIIKPGGLLDQAEAALVQAEWNLINGKPIIEEQIREAKRNLFIYLTRYNKTGGPGGFRAQADSLLNYLFGAVQEFDNLLNGSAANDIRAIKDRLNEFDISNNLPNFAIYGWKDDGDRWHVVRADSRAPGRCGGKCTRCKGDSSWGMFREPHWPWVKTWTKNSKTRRCYALVDSLDTFGTGEPNTHCDEKDKYDDDIWCFRGGAVGARVIRYDEEKDIVARFANNIRLWRFMFRHPSASPTGSISELESQCDSLGEGAFMVYDYETSPGCYEAANKILRRGVMSTSCAEYFFHDRTRRNFSFKFVPCFPADLPFCRVGLFDDPS